MRTILLAAMLATVSAHAAPTLIKDLKLTGDANGNGYSITNAANIQALEGALAGRSNDWNSVTGKVTAAEASLLSVANATNAAEAAYATSAGSTPFADHAVTADTATTAENANTAGTATVALGPANAEDFRTTLGLGSLATMGYAPTAAVATGALSLAVQELTNATLRGHATVSSNLTVGGTITGNGAGITNAPPRVALIAASPTATYINIDEFDVAGWVMASNAIYAAVRFINPIGTSGQVRRVRVQFVTHTNDVGRVLYSSGTGTTTPLTNAPSAVSTGKWLAVEWSFLITNAMARSVSIASWNSTGTSNLYVTGATIEQVSP